jgi:hypothetical protein
LSQSLLQPANMTESASAKQTAPLVRKMHRWVTDSA